MRLTDIRYQLSDIRIVGSWNLDQVAIASGFQVPDR